MQQLTRHLLAPGSPLVAEIERRARASSADLVETAAALAPLAELSWNEHQTTDFLARRLSQQGWRVQTFGGQSGLIARIGPATSPLKPIALRMELDALPSGDGGARHTCGHNYHMATIDEAGGILADLSSRFGGRFVIIGQPAEEVGTPRSGADFIIENGGLQYADGELVSGVLGFHGRTGLRRGTVAVLPNGGPFYAGTAKVIANVTARGGHGGIPWTTDRTAEIFMEFLLALRNGVYCGSLAPYDPVVYVTNAVEIPQISGPTSQPIDVIPSAPFNVIPTTGKALGNLRWFAPDTPAQVRQAFAEVVNQYNTRYEGLHVSVDFEVGYGPTVVDPLLARDMAQAAGPVAQVVEANRTTLAEDMGKYWTAGGVPVGFAEFGLGEQAYPETGPVRNPFEHHSDRFAVSAQAEAELWRMAHTLVVSALLASAAGD